MLNFEYKGIQGNKYVEGEIEALNNAEASHKLKEQKIIITKLKEAKKKKAVTKKEKKYPKVINGSRKRRIALGAGVDIQEVNRLLKQFKNMQIMMKKMSKHGIGNLEKMFSDNSLQSNNIGSMLNNLKR